MKSMKRLLFTALAVTFLLASCTIQKRVYRSGYHVEWYSAKQSTAKEVLANDNSEEKNHETPTIEQLPSANSTLDSPQQEGNATTIAPSSSANPSPAQVQARETTSFSQKETTAKAQAKPALITQKQLKASIKKTKKTSSSDDDDENSGGRGGGLLAIGWILILLGLGILLFSSIVVGAVLMLFGLLFAIAGGSKRRKASASSTNKKEKTNYIDVVYLKNGSIIRGMVIEMIPNVSIKIQTKDGNTFFFKMEEVDKMTKEKAN